MHLRTTDLIKEKKFYKCKERQKFTNKTKEDNRSHPKEHYNILTLECENEEVKEMPEIEFKKLTAGLPRSNQK